LFLRQPRLELELVGLNALEAKEMSLFGCRRAVRSRMNRTGLDKCSTHDQMQSTINNVFFRPSPNHPKIVLNSEMQVINTIIIEFTQNVKFSMPP
jgi:hypothetical protein